MGYDLHITRRAFWDDRDGPEIGFAEWCARAKSDPQIQPDSENEPTDFLVSAGESEEPWPLWWGRGEVYTKNPSNTVILKMVDIANRVNAHVLGDDGESYTRSTVGELLISNA